MSAEPPAISVVHTAPMAMWDCPHCSVRIKQTDDYGQFATAIAKHAVNHPKRPWGTD